MKRRLNIVVMTLFAIVCYSLRLQAQEKQSINGYLVPMCIYNGDTIPCVQLRTVYIFRPLKFKNEKERQEYYRLIRNVKKVYPISRELSFAQGKLLIKLIDRQSNSTSYELVKAFMGPFKAGFYQTFAALFGASLKKEYDPQGEDKLTERVVLMVENGQI